MKADRLSNPGETDVIDDYVSDAPDVDAPTNFSSEPTSKSGSKSGSKSDSDSDSSPKSASPRSFSTKSTSRRPSSRDAELVRRRRLATTGIAMFGVVAAACAVYAFARDRWATFSLFQQAGLVFGSLAALYGGAGISRKLNETPLSNLLFLSGSIFFGAGIVLLSAEPEIADRSLGLWTLGVFALAASLPAKTLHYLTALGVVFWIFKASPELIPAAFAVCALGEYWAWRRRSPSVSALYFGVCVVAAAAKAYTNFRWDLIAPGGAIFGLFLYWFGATFRNAIVRGVGVVVGTLGLAFASFPEYWATLRVDGDVSTFHSRFEALIYATLFVVVGCNSIIEGARRSLFRFIFGIVVFSTWAVCQAVSASRTFGPTGAAIVLSCVAAAIFGLLFLERRTRLRRERAGKERRAGTPSATTDALSDDAEFDDVFDAEARVAAETPRILAISSALDEYVERLEKKFRVPAIWAAVGVQFAILFVVLSMR